MVTAILLMPLMAIIGLVVDEGFWVIASTRLQIAADAAAMGASFALTTPAFKQQSASTQLTTLQTVAQFEANAAVSKLLGTLQTPPSISYDGSGYTTVTVTLTTQPPAFFAPALNVPVPTLSATATVSLPPTSSCVLALGGSGTGIQVDNQGSITATGCGLFSDSVSNPAIYLNSGTLSGSSIAAVGTVSKSNSGSNSMTPSAGQSGQSTVTDPNASKTAPTPGACNPTNSFTSYGTYNFSPATFCNGLTIGGNGSTDSFAPGVYIINNGNLTFNNANIVLASGVTFVLTGTSPGSLYWQNNSSAVAITAPNSGTTAGIAFWLVCNSAGSQTVSIQNGGTIQVSGAIYAPCASTNIGNATKVQPPSGGTLSFISSSIYVHGSAALTTAASSGSSSSSTTMRLTN
jgi:hypothetical protein